MDKQTKTLSYFEALDLIIKEIKHAKQSMFKTMQNSEHIALTYDGPNPYKEALKYVWANIGYKPVEAGDSFSPFILRHDLESMEKILNDIIDGWSNFDKDSYMRICELLETVKMIHGYLYKGDEKCKKKN